MTRLNFIKESRKWKVFNKIAVYFSRGVTLIGFFTGTVYVLLGMYYDNSDDTKDVLLSPDNVWPLFVGLLLVMVAAFPAFLYYVWFFQIAPFIDKSVYDPSALDIDEDYRGKFRWDYFKIIGICVILVGLLLWGIVTGFEPINEFRKTNVEYLESVWVVLPVFLLLLSIGLFVLLKKALPDLIATEEEESGSVAPVIQNENTKSLGILTFEDLSLQPSDKLAILSERAPTWLSREINKHQLAEAYDFPSFLKEYQSIDGLEEPAIRDKFNRMPHRRLIKGSYRQEGGRLHLHSEIKERTTHKTLKVIEVDAPLDDLSKGMKELSEKVLGWLAREDKKELNLEQNPISYGAFLHLEKAKEFYHDPAIFLGELEKALAIDPHYFEPKILRVGYYFNIQDTEKADDCLKELEATIEAWDGRQKNLIKLYRSLLMMDYSAAYQCMKEEYFHAPRDLQTNTSVMSMALFYVNKPADIDSYFSQIPMTKEEVRQSEFCQDRLYLRAWAQVLNKQFHPALDGLRPYIQSPGFRRLKEVFLTALIRSRQFKKVDEALKSFELLDQTDATTLSKLYLKTAMEYKLVNEHSKAQLFFSKIGAFPPESANQEAQLQALFYKEDFEGFLRLLENSTSGNGILKGLHAIALYATGKSDQAEALFEGSAGMGQSGITYAQACYRSYIGEQDKALKLLRQALNQGHFYTRSSFANDPLLDKLHNRTDFYQLLRLRH